ncbi:MAG: GNAT family N-acetyltransferase [Halobacteriales archaeon]
MHLRRLPAEEAALRRYVEELWVPYHRDLEATVERHALDDDADLVAEEVEFRLDRLAADEYRAWVAVDAPAEGDVSGESDVIEEGDASASGACSLAAIDADLAGFVTTDVDTSPPVFDRPDRLVVGDIYVREPYRGTGLADDLIARAAERAREAGCGELALDVDVDNERAIAFYEKLGFDPYRRRLLVGVDDLDRRSG